MRREMRPNGQIDAYALKIKGEAMTTKLKLSILAAAAVLSVVGAGVLQAQQNNMTFFVTSAGSGKGGDLGGIAGADAHCQSLAAAAGAGGKTWHAYLSSATPPGGQATNARDRIGNGPWQNAKGVVVAKDVNDLHTNPNINKETLLDEKGERIKVRGDNPNQHDMLTGSTMEGRAFPANLNLTCNNWSSSTFGSAMLGHGDREGIADTVYQHSWNSSHMSRDCTQPGLVATGGNGLFYCFAAQ
jgi:hypothetical protein